MNKRLMIVGGLALVALAGCGQPSPAEINEQGNALYEQQIYAQALQQYQEASLLAPDRPEPYVNMGAARYEMGDYLGAIETPKNALPYADPATTAIIHYNQGNAHFRLAEYEQAIERYKDALRLIPDDMDAKHNLELAQKQLEEQQQQQQQAQNGQEPQDPQDQQDGEGQEQPDGQQPQPGQPQQPGGGQNFPEPPPSSLSPEEAEELLDQMRRQQQRGSEDLYDNYAVGGGEDGEPTDTPGGEGNDW